MKKVLLFSIVMVVYTIFLHQVMAQTGWNQPPNLTNHNLNGVITAFKGFSAYEVQYAYGDSGTILRKAPGDLDWTVASVGTSKNIYSLGFTNIDTGFAVGDSGIVLQTNNRGFSWTPIGNLPPNTQALLSCAMPNEIFLSNPKLIVISGSKGNIIRTTNKGASWTIFQTGTQQPLREVQFVGTNITTLMACGDSGYILRSTNVGKDWTKIHVPYLQDFYALDFHSYDTGWVVGSQGIILYTNNGGISWSKQNSGVSVTLRDCQYVGNGVCFVSGEKGIVLTTNDYGTTWKNISVDTTLTLRGVDFADAVHGVIVGDSGTVFETTTGGSYQESFFSYSSSISFGPVLFHSTKTATLTIGNAGIAPLVIQTVSSTSPHFSIEPSSMTIAGGTTGEFTIEYSPSSVGKDSTQFEFKYANGDSIRLISGTGNGVFPIAASTWKQVYPVPFGTSINKISFLDDNTACAVGDRGGIFLSTDAGLHWDRKNTGNENSIILTDVTFPTASTGYAAGYYGALYRTTDGGETWNRINSNRTFNFRKIKFSNEQHGIALDQDGTTYTTSNAGLTWSIFTDQSTLPISDFDLSTSGVCMIITASGNILKTTDFGISWSTIVPFSYYGFRNVFSIGGNSWLAVDRSNNNIYKTVTNGLSWEQIFTLPNPFFEYTAISFSGDAGCIVTEEYTNQSAITLDGGNSWTYRMLEPGEKVTSVVIQSNTAFMPGHNSISPASPFVFRFHWNGSEFENMYINSLSRTLHDVATLSIGIAVCVGDSGTVLKTTDDGLTWSNLLQGTQLENIGIRLNSISFPTPTSGVIVGDYGVILNTTNAGEHWGFQRFPLDVDLLSVQMVDTSLGYASGTNGIILRTTNSGETWSAVESSFPGITWKGLSARPNGSVFAISTSNKIARSFNNGDRWEISSLPSSITSDINAITFVNDSTLFIAGNSSLIIRSTDSGLSWSLIEAPLVNANFYDIAFSNDTVGYLTGQYATILKTVNAGLTWELRNGGTPGTLSNDLLGISILDEGHAYTAGNAGIIFRLEHDESQIINDVRTSQQQPLQYSLEQNYPNPFNPVTEITFSVADWNAVTIKIYDMLGREVSTLVDEKLQPGIYHRQWNASSAPSGVYYYRITSLTFVNTKRMVLIK